VTLSHFIRTYSFAWTQCIDAARSWERHLSGFSLLQSPEICMETFWDITDQLSQIIVENSCCNIYFSYLTIKNVFTD